MILRKDQEEHENDSQQHLQLAIDTVYQQQMTIKQQENMLAQLQSKFAELVSKVITLEQTPLSDLTLSKLPQTSIKYRVTDFAHHKASDDLVYSPPFYTSPGGYKMCIRMDANGDGDGEGTHISVFACLMRGENDDHVPWPFTGTVTFKLLNQLEDENHHCAKVVFSSDKVAAQRVINEEQSSD